MQHFSERSELVDGPISRGRARWQARVDRLALAADQLDALGRQEAAAYPLRSGAWNIFCELAHVCRRRVAAEEAYGFREDASAGAPPPTSS